MLFRNSTTQVLEAKNLTFRDVTRDDVQRIVELAGVWEVASMTGRIPYPYSEAAALQWVEGLPPGEFVRAIVLDKVLIGICGLMAHDDEKSAEIGYWLGKPYWGRGYATLAAQKLVDQAFKLHSFECLTAGHLADNPASGRVLKKLGFAPTGQSPCWCEARSRKVDAIRYELHKPKSWWQRSRRHPA